MAHRYFLVYFIFTCCTVAGQSPKYALRGLKVHLKPDITGQPDEILWKHNDKRVVEFNGNEEHVYSPYENRITLDWVSAELDITNLRYEDSGEYALEANKLSISTFQLEVIDKVVKPTISCEMNEDSSSDISGTQATLKCSADPKQPQLMKFEWSSGGNVQTGPNLTISLGEKHDDEVYSCVVRNPLSNETATFTAKDCYSVKSSSTALTATLVTLTIILLILIGVSGIVLCKLRRKACFAKGNKDDLEKQSPLGGPEGSDKKTDQGDEICPLLDRAPTLPSTQRLVQSNSNMRPNEPADNHKEDAVSHVDTEKESVNEKDEEPKSFSANGVSPLTQNSPNMAPKDIADEHEEDANSDQVTGETLDETFREANTGETNESDDSTEEKHPSTVSEENDPETALHKQDSGVSQGETHTGEDNQQEPDKPVSEDENESDGVSDSEEKDEEETSKQPQSPTPTKPDNRNLDTFQESPDTAHAKPDPEEEDEIRHDSGDSGGQSDKSTEDADKESENEADEEPKSPPANGVSPPLSPLTQNSPNMAPKDIADEHEEDANSDQVTRETLDETFREADTGETNESDDSAEEQKHSSTVSEENGPETTLHKQDSGVSQRETHTGEDNQQEPDKPVSEDENESDGVGDGEEKDEEETSKQLQSPTPTKPDNRSIETFQESPDTAHGELDPEDKTKLTN